ECCGGTFILQDRTIFLCTFLKNEKNERGFKKSVTLTFWTAPLPNKPTILRPPLHVELAQVKLSAKLCIFMVLTNI
ncbi:hypothetical protein, partial [Anoxybacteroides rupiense]|uniref:hypothetical protein n=1 Tax=Anoxybacteroides rupiense TaxID=311460 RepID=UPI0036719E90